MKLLFVENEKILLEEMVDHFSSHGCVCEQAKNFDEAVLKISAYTYDHIILDIAIPGGNGIDLITKIKINKNNAGILILSAKNSLSDKVTSLNLGADDYLTKPFHLEELRARINALQRRKVFNCENQLIFDEFVVDVNANLLLYKGTQVNVTKKEYQLLMYFLINKNRVLSKSSIAEHIWGDNFDEADNFDTIYVHMVNLRKKLIKANGKDYIKTVWGMGYKFSA